MTNILAGNLITTLLWLLLHVTPGLDWTGVLGGRLRGQPRDGDAISKGPFIQKHRELLVQLLAVKGVSGLPAHMPHASCLHAYIHTYIHTYIPMRPCLTLPPV